MRDRAPGARRWMLLACAVCTAWLVVQNAVLVTFVPWERLPVLAHPASRVAGLLLGAVVLAAFSTVAFALGWLAARHPRHGERSHG